jgi:hypothetical protein
MEDLFSSLLGGGTKQNNPTIVNPALLGIRGHKARFRALAAVFGLLAFLSLGAIFPAMAILRYVLHVCFVVYVISYKNPGLNNLPQRLLMSAVFVAVVEIVVLVINGSL